jgi:putative aminopeptidase FrvX
VVEKIMALAKEMEMPLQHEATSRTTGTDADDIYPTKGGIPSALVSIPMRYMHSTVEMIDFADVERCISLLTRFVNGVSGRDEFVARLL